MLSLTRGLISTLFFHLPPGRCSRFFVLLDDPAEQVGRCAGG